MSRQNSVFVKEKQKASTVILNSTSAQGKWNTVFQELPVVFTLTGSCFYNEKDHCCRLRERRKDYMAANNKNSHLTLSEREIIEKGIFNGSAKTAIAEILGKDRSTIGKEIREHRYKNRKCPLPLECSNYKRCKHGRYCNKECTDYVPFACKRRDRSPGACNGCGKRNSCRYDQYNYDAQKAQKEYESVLVSSRSGINATRNEIKELGEKIKPFLAQGLSLYAIKQNHPEITQSEKTLYTYIENGVFTDAGVSITCLDLKRQVRRKLTKKKEVIYSKRKDNSYLKGRMYKDYENYISENPDVSVVEMDTVYNDIRNGPFLQTFKFLKYDLLFCIYHEKKDSEHMRNGILFLEKILGKEIFAKEVNVLLTDRGSEFPLGEETEIREDGSRRTRIFYCDAMASYQKGSLENVHILLREICPKECDLRELGLDSQEKADRISANINSYPKEKLNGKTSFQLLGFLSPSTAERFLTYGLIPIDADQVTLKPYLLKK